MLLAVAEPGLVGPVEGVELAVPVAGALLVLLAALLSVVLGGVELLLLAVEPCETVEFEDCDDMLG